MSSMMMMMMMMMLIKVALVSGLKLEELSKAEDDGTMTSMEQIGADMYRVVATNHDSYIRFTMPTGCQNLDEFAFLKLKAWAAPGAQFTVELRQGKGLYRFCLVLLFVDSFLFSRLFRAFPHSLSFFLFCPSLSSFYKYLIWPDHNSQTGI